MACQDTRTTFQRHSIGLLGQTPAIGRRDEALNRDRRLTAQNTTGMDRGGYMLTVLVVVAHLEFRLRSVTVSVNGLFNDVHLLVVGGTRSRGVIGGTGDGSRLPSKTPIGALQEP